MDTNSNHLFQSGDLVKVQGKFYQVHAHKEHLADDAGPDLREHVFDGPVVVVINAPDHILEVLKKLSTLCITATLCIGDTHTHIYIYNIKALVYVYIISMSVYVRVFMRVCARACRHAHGDRVPRRQRDAPCVCV